MSDLRERFGGHFGNISAAMTAFRNNEKWREAVLVEIENLAAAVRAEEREACAKVAFEKRVPVHFDNGLMRLGYLSAGNDIAAAIRGRP